MPKGIFCMEKNLSEVIENIKEDQTKDFYQVTSYRGKVFIIANTFLFDMVTIVFLIATLKSR